MGGIDGGTVYSSCLSVAIALPSGARTAYTGGLLLIAFHFTNSDTTLATSRHKRLGYLLAS